MAKKTDELVVEIKGDVTDLLIFKKIYFCYQTTVISLLKFCAVFINWINSGNPFKWLDLNKVNNGVENGETKRLHHQTLYDSGDSKRSSFKQKHKKI